MSIIRLIIGLLLLGYGLSMAHSWLLAPTAEQIPYVGLALAAGGVAVLTSAFRRKRTSKPPVKPEVVAAGAVGAAVAALGIKYLLDEVRKKSELDRIAAIAKLRELEEMYQKSKPNLTPEERAFFEQKIAEYKRKLGVQ